MIRNTLIVILVIITTITINELINYELEISNIMFTQLNNKKAIPHIITNKIRKRNKESTKNNKKQWCQFL